MKIQLVSDLHIEHRRDQKKFKWANPEADILIIAGDACDHPSVDRLVAMLQAPDIAGKEIIYVPGNHEHYRSPGPQQTLSRLQEALQGLNEGRVRFAYEDVLEAPQRASTGQQVRFICATLWSDISKPFDRLTALGLSDFMVPGLTVDWYIQEHQRHAAFVERELGRALEDGVIPIVVTHHCPSHRSVPERFRGHALNACFTTELSDLMYGPEAPPLWLHGHTHDSFDYTIGETRVVCNPYGYPGEERVTQSGFNPSLLLEV